MARSKAEWMRIIGSNIRRVSKLSGLTALEISKRAGVHAATISQFKNSTDPNPSLDTLVSLADALGVGLKDLLFEESLGEEPKITIAELPKYLTLSEWLWEKLYDAIPGWEQLDEKDLRRRFEAFLFVVRPDLEFTSQQKEIIWRERSMFQKRGV
jgi:transcriptional regulator with XRE-family HTH domain